MEDKGSPQSCRKYKPEKGLESKIRKQLNSKKRNFQMGQVFGQTPHRGKPAEGSNAHRKSPMGKQKDEEAACCVLRRMWSVSLGARLLVGKT